MKPYGIYAPAVLDDLYRRIVAIETRRVAALAAMRAANAAGDDDAWDRAGEAHDDASDEATDIRHRIDELEREAGHDEWRAERSALPIVL